MKKLLIIGANSFFLDVVNVCRKKGIQSIILDNNPSAISKKYADIALNVDTYNKEAVLEVAKKYEIDGVFVGWSDHNLYTALYVAECMDIPFYATKEQLDLTTNKDEFKKLCIENGVPVFPEIEYTSELLEDANTYPVIIKPVDSAGSKGITICKNKKELDEAYAKALELSFSKKIIIERAVKFQHVNIYYTIVDGEPYLSAMCDRNVYYPDKSCPPLPVALVHPSKHLSEFQHKVDGKIKNMFKNIGMKNGVAFLQGFYDENSKEFYIYEMGYRLNGGSTYFLIDYFSGYNQVEMLIEHALNMPISNKDKIKVADGSFKNEGIMLVLSVKPGKIKNISGVEEIKKKEDIIHVMQMYFVGDEINVPSGTSQAQIFMYIYIDKAEEESYKLTIDFIKNTLVVTDEADENILLNVWEIAKTERSDTND